MIVELEITAMAHGGSGIGRLEGRVIFCPGVIPGDIVRAEITDDSKKSLWRAQALSIITPSPHRVPHIWPEADISRPAAERAGGADYGHIALPHQRELKTHILKDSLMRFGGISEDVLQGVTVQGVPGDDERNGLGWRTRVTLHADESGRLGPYAEKSHTVIPVKDLPLASDAIRSSGIVNTPFEGAHTVRALDTTGSGVRLVIDEQAPGDILERVGEVEFHLSDQSFWQVHQSAPALLSDAVTRAIDPARLHA
ncbi:MAG: TRAM domain-containing protein, partial [Pontimonas sp.]